MNKIDFSSKVCYDYVKSRKMREYFKIGLFFSLFVVSAAGFVLATTLGVLHYNNTRGQGGLDTPGLPELSAKVFQTEVTVEPNEVTSVMESEEDSPLYYFSYCIQKGDMIGILAEKFGINEDTIISVNNIKSSRLIQIGDYLKIPSMPGILYTVKTGDETISSIAEKYEVNADKCALINNLDKGSALTAGMQLFVPDALLDNATRLEINGDLFMSPIKAWYYVSSTFGYRKNPFDSAKRTYHGGIDLACPQGTKIYAALSGTVTSTGYNSSYGNYVIVTHHSGYTTLYGHMSKILAKKGQFVTNATNIGLVGSTGMSTGPHLHFSVYKNGRGINPVSVTKFK